MKLLLYSRDFFPSTGGVQTIVLELASGLAESRNGIEVTVITKTAGATDADHQFPFTILRRPNFRTLVGTVRQSDLLHLAGAAIIPLLLGLALRKPVIVEHHGFQTVCPNGQLFYEPDDSTCPGHYMAGNYRQCIACNKKAVGSLASVRMLLLTPVRRWLCNRASVNITPTHWLASVLKLKRQKTVLHGLPRAPRGSDSGVYDSCTSTFAYQGRLVSTKGIRVLLRAFEHLCQNGRATRLLIIGTGPEERALKTEVARFAGRVEFLGQVPKKELDTALAKAASVVMPSIAGEVFGLVAAENMLRGKVVITSDLGSLREVVGDAGLTFPTGNASALEDCMRVVMDDASLAEHLGNEARERAEQIFRRDRMTQEHISVYREAVGSNRTERNKVDAS